MKTCTKCKQEFPKTLEFFYKSGKHLTSECKVCNKERVKAWYLANPEKKNAAARTTYKAKPEKVKNLLLAKNKAWRKTNPEKVIAIQRAWRETNPEKVRAQHIRRKAKKLGHAFEPYTLKEIFETYGTNCYLCDLPIDLNAPRKVGVLGWKSGLHIEHFVAIVNGGSDTIKNVRPSHGWCNLTKGTK